MSWYFWWADLQESSAKTAIDGIPFIPSDHIVYSPLCSWTDEPDHRCGDAEEWQGVFEAVHQDRTDDDCHETPACQHGPCGWARCRWETQPEGSQNYPDAQGGGGPDCICR